MVVNKITVPGSHLVQQDLTHDKFVYNDQVGAVYQPDPNIIELQNAFFKYTITPPILSNFAWNNIKLNWSRKYDTTAPSDFIVKVTLEGILPDGRSELLGEQYIDTITSSIVTEDLFFDLLNSRGNASINKIDGQAPVNKIQVNLPKPWKYFENVVLKKDWMNGWAKRKGQNIVKGVGYARSFPVQVTVDYVAGMKTDFSDVRFTLPDGRTPVCIYRYSYTSGTTAEFWLNYPDSDSQKGLFMYYGNDSATLHSNIDSVFTFADDFSDNTINTNKWQTVSGGGGSIAETSGIIRITSDGTNRIYLRSKPQFQTPIIFEFRARRSENIEAVFSWDGVLSGAADTPRNGYFFQYTRWTSPARFNLIKYVNGTPIILNTYNYTLDTNWRNYKISVGKSGFANVIKIYMNGSQILTSTDADNPLNTGYFGLTARETPAAPNADYDFVRCIPYVSTYPYPGSMMGEESGTGETNPDTPGEDDTSILYNNSDGFRRPRYLIVKERGKTEYNTIPTGMLTREIFNLGYTGVDLYMALRLGVNVLADKNCQISFNNLEYAYEVI